MIPSKPQFQTSGSSQVSSFQKHLEVLETLDRKEISKATQAISWHVVRVKKNILIFSERFLFSVDQI